VAVGIREVTVALGSGGRVGLSSKTGVGLGVEFWGVQLISRIYPILTRLIKIVRRESEEVFISIT
jgi:hypothetical protein